VASDIGPVDPAEYFPYLLGIHEISEADRPQHVREAALRGSYRVQIWIGSTERMAASMSLWRACSYSDAQSMWGERMVLA
jgi:hypothetical protein